MSNKDKTVTIRYRDKGEIEEVSEKQIEVIRHNALKWYGDANPIEIAKGYPKNGIRNCE